MEKQRPSLRSTKNRTPFIVVLSEEHETKEAALKREKQIKLMLIPSNISSKDINSINTFFRRTNTPKTPIRNKKKEWCNQ